MIKEILYKMFGIEPFPCNSCETLRGQLESVNFEKKILLDRLLNPVQPVEPIKEPEYEPIKPKNVSWAVRRQMLEAEDREKAKLMRMKTEELERELKIPVQEPIVKEN